ncbi:MAG: hypothetical protein AB8B49_06150 [Nitratireductor sp.]
MNLETDNHAKASTLSTSMRANFLQLLCFMVFGFGVLFTFGGTLVRLILDYYEGNEFAFMFNFEEAIFLLIDGLALALPITAVCFVFFLVVRRFFAISTLVRFLLCLLVALCIIWAALALYGLFTGGVSRLQRFAIFGSYIPPLGLACGMLVWPIRSLFGFKIL